MGDTVEPKPRRDDFRVAIICALPLEGNAVGVLFDKIWRPEELAFQLPSNDLTVGRMGQHFVLLSWLGKIGKVKAGIKAGLIKKKFEKIEVVLVVGICAGMPLDRNNRNAMIELGDVVISRGIIQYDEGKMEKDRWIQKNKPQKPEDQGCLDKLEHIDTDRDALKRFAHGYLDHALEHKKFCDLKSKTSRKPEVHFGYVASGDTVVKTAAYRDEIEGRLPERPIGFEMEASGVLTAFSDKVIVIKGVCDYASEEKEKSWQTYAAVTSAAYMKAFLNEWKPKKSKRQYLHDKAHGIKGSSVNVLKSVIPSKVFTASESVPQPDSDKNASEPVASAPAGDAKKCTTAEPPAAASVPTKRSAPAFFPPHTAVQSGPVVDPPMATLNEIKGSGHSCACPSTTEAVGEPSEGASSGIKTNVPTSTPTKALVKREPMIEQSPAVPKASPEAQSSQQEADHAHEDQVPVDNVPSQPLRIHPEQKAVDPVRPPSPTPSTAPTLVESPKNDIHFNPHIMVPTSPIKKAPIVQVISQETSDMFVACKARNVPDVRRLLATGKVDVIATDEGHGMLGLAIGKVKVNTDGEKMEKIAAIITLLCGPPHKASPNILDGFGYAPIHYCARSMNAPAAALLIKHRANINMLDKDKCTALNHLVNDRIPDVAFANMLIANGGKRGPIRLDALVRSANARRKAVYTAALTAGTV